MTKSDILKQNLIEAMEKSLGVVTTACKTVGCSRETFYRYCKEDSKFNQKIRETFLETQH